MGNDLAVETPPLTDYDFDEPKVAPNFDFSKKWVYMIGDKESAEQAYDILKKQDVVYVDCEGENFGNERATVRLVFHDCPGDIAILSVAEICGKKGITICNVHDTQVAYFFAEKSKNPAQNVKDLPRLSFYDLYEKIFKEEYPAIKIKLQGSATWQYLNEDKIKYAALHVLLLPPVFHNLRNRIASEFAHDYYEMVKEYMNRKTDFVCL